MCFCFSSSWSCCCCFLWSSHFSFQCCCVNAQWSSHSFQWCSSFFFSVLLLSLLLMFFLPSFRHHCCFFDATPLSSWFCFSQCNSFLAWLFFLFDIIIALLSSSTSLFLLFPPRHYSFSFSTSSLLLDGTPPTFRWRCSYSSLTFFLFLLLFDVIHVLPWHRSSYSSLTPFLLFNNVPLLVLFQHDFCSYTTSLPLLFFNVTPLPAPLQHYSSSSMPLLFLFDTILVPPIASTFLLPFNVVVFPFNVVTIPLILNWYFRPSCFCKCGRSKLFKFDLFFSS